MEERDFDRDRSIDLLSMVVLLARLGQLVSRELTVEDDALFCPFDRVNGVDYREWHIVIAPCTVMLRCLFDTSLLDGR